MSKSGLGRELRASERDTGHAGCLITVMSMASTLVVMASSSDGLQVLANSMGVFFTKDTPPSAVARTHCPAIQAL